MSTTILGSKAKTSANNFYANIIKTGYDAISDVNDRDQGAQDPIVVVNVDKLQSTGILKLGQKDLDYYSDYVYTKEHRKTKKNLSEVQGYI